MKFIKRIFGAGMFHKRKLKYEILMVFSALICLTVICEILYSGKANKALLLGFERSYYSDKMSRVTSNWLETYLMQIELILSVLSKNATMIGESDSNFVFRDFEAMFKESIKKTAFIESVYVGLNDGTYFQIRRRGELRNLQTDPGRAIPASSSYIKRTINKDEHGALRESWVYMSEDFSPVRVETLKNVVYDPRDRYWYVNAELNKSTRWSDAYSFDTDHSLGMTVSHPILNSDGKKVKGVVAIDFALKDFHQILNFMKTTNNSIVYLLNDRSEVIATTANLSPNSKNNILLKRANLTNDPILKEASKHLVGSEAHHASFSVAGTEYISTVHQMYKRPFAIVSVTPLTDFTDNLDRIRIGMLLISLFTFLISTVLVFYMARRISNPISKVCKSAIAISNLEVETYESLPSSEIFEIQELSSAMNVLERSMSTFSKYAPKALVKKLLRNGTVPKLGGKTKEVTILFSDIEKFSTISENLPAEYLMLHLSEYFDECTKVITQHNGTIDKYIGDSIMAMWGAPDPDEDHVINSCKAALECQKLLEELKNKWKPLGKPPFPTRIGIHTGNAIIGNIGSKDRMNFTAIGDAVNIASRLEGLNKFYGTKILASENVERAARSGIIFRIVDRVAVKGRASDLIVFEPICSISDADENYYDLIELSSKSKEAFELYQSQNFSKALELYTLIAESFPDRKKSVIPMIETCREFIKKPPIDWDGIRHMSVK